MSERHLHFDAYSGAAGNMLLGALLALGVPRRVVREAIARIGLSEVGMRVRRVQRGALDALYVSFKGPRRTPHERHWRSIRRLLDRAALRAGIDVPACTLPDEESVAQAIHAGADTPGAERALAFGSEQLLLQHRALFDLLEARAEARVD